MSDSNFSTVIRNIGPFYEARGFKWHVLGGRSQPGVIGGHNCMELVLGAWWVLLHFTSQTRSCGSWETISETLEKENQRKPLSAEKKSEISKCPCNPTETGSGDSSARPERSSSFCSCWKHAVTHRAAGTAELNPFCYAFCRIFDFDLLRFVCTRDVHIECLFLMIIM